MTNAEYIQALRNARKTYPGLLLRTLKELKSTYLDAAELASKTVLKAQYQGLSRLTLESWHRIRVQLENGALLIQEAMDRKTPAIVNKSINELAKIDIRYILDSVEKAGADIITQTGLIDMYTAVNEGVLRTLVNRIWQDGYTFSDRVWALGVNYQDQIKRVISAGVAQNRPIESIARDIQVYVKDGKVALVNRFGPDLTRGTKEFLKRVGNRIDYRALRLIRSELYASLQEDTIQAGRINPANVGYEWVLESGRQHWDCPCPDIAADSPYTYENIPNYPHANCRCQIRQIMRPHKEFVNDLERWVHGESVEYLDNWYNNIYVFYDR